LKVYNIPSPAKLREAADMIKWERDRKQALAFAKHWEKDPDMAKVTLEVSRNAHLYRHDPTGKRQLLATMYVAGARQFVKGLEEMI